MTITILARINLFTRSIAHDWPEQTQQEIYCFGSSRTSKSEKEATFTYRPKTP